MDKEESIDLRELMPIVIRHKKIMCIIIAACTAMAMITAFFILPKTYESTTLVRAKSSSKLDLSGASAAMAALGVGGSTSSPTMIYTELMKSRAVLDPIIDQLDLPAEKKEKLTAKGFAKSSLEIINTKGTDLIEITAKGKSPEEAQQISQGVVDGFLNLMTQMNQDQQSLMAKFLSGRIDVARDDLDQATQKLDAFGQDKKTLCTRSTGKSRD
jgi:capsular polysaccharide biosynthesis protein